MSIFPKPHTIIIHLRIIVQTMTNVTPRRLNIFDKFGGIESVWASRLTTTLRQMRAYNILFMKLVGWYTIQFTKYIKYVPKICKISFIAPKRLDLLANNIRRTRSECIVTWSALFQDWLAPFVTNIANSLSWDNTIFIPTGPHLTRDHIHQRQGLHWDQ